MPGAQSQEALDILEKDFPAYAGSTNNQVVFQATSGTLAQPNDQSAIDTTRQNISGLPKVAGVTDLVPSKDGTIGYVSVAYTVSASDLKEPDFEALENATEPAKAAGLEVAFGGDLASEFTTPGVGIADKIGIGVALLVLILALGSVVAAGLPIVTAILGLAVGLSGVLLFAAVVPVPIITPTLATMIGLGVGIDYALFMISRYREELRAGWSTEDAIGRTNATSGMSVIFAGGTVVIAISGLVAAGLPFVTYMGFGAAIAVAVAVVAAVTLMPALLALVGRHVRSLPVRLISEPEPGGPPGFWARWAARVCRRPVGYGLVTAIVLLVIASPTLSMELGIPDASTLPKSNTQRQAYDWVSQGFGPGFNGPLLIVVELPSAGDTAAVANLEAALPTATDVAAVTPPQFSPDGTVAIVNVVPDTAPDDPATTTLVKTLRNTVIPQATAGTGATALVTGSTALYIDLSDKIASRLPLFIGAVILLSVLLLMVVFRSLLIPLTAALMNVVSIGAAYGVVVAVFQWGWAREVIGLDSTVPIASYVPMLMFAALFGLSMDYEVFLVSRIREHYVQTGDTRLSIAQGVGTTARVITSAAIIMICVFVSFLLVDDAIVRMFGVGLAAGVLMDATLIRMVLVPSIMTLLGGANWWLPPFLDRLLPHIELEGPATEGRGAPPATTPPQEEPVPVTTASVSTRSQPSRAWLGAEVVALCALVAVAGAVLVVRTF
ncbi:MAG: MMPL family transporter [Actinomycetota bacterium]|nr:MMPL family transporter [Actinomycetota bacterium]